MDAPLPGLGTLGRAVEQSQGLALQLPRPRRRAPGRGARAHPARPLLQRAVRQSRRRSTSRRATTTPRSTRGRARSTTPSAAVRRVHAGRDRQPGAARKGGKLPMPVLAIGGDHSYGPSMTTELRVGGDDVRSGVITDSGHWIMEEQPQQAVSIILSSQRTNESRAEPSPDEAPSVLMTLALEAWGQRLSKRPGAKRPKCSRAVTQIQASLIMSGKD